MPGLTTGYTGSQIFGTTFAGDIIIDTPAGLPADGEWFAYRVPVGEYNSLTVSVNPIVFAIDPEIWITALRGEILGRGIRKVAVKAEPGELYFICVRNLQFGKSVLNFLPANLDVVPDVKLDGSTLRCPMMAASIWIRRAKSEDRWIRYSGSVLSIHSFPIDTFATAPGFWKGNESRFLAPVITSSSSGLSVPPHIT